MQLVVVPGLQNVGTKLGSAILTRPRLLWSIIHEKDYLNSLEN